MIGRRRWGRRLLWFAALYAAGVGVVGAVAWGLRAWLLVAQN